MLDEILFGSILAVAAGLTVVAYRYPAVYQKSCIPLIGLVAAVWIAQLEFSTGYSTGSTEEQKKILELNKSQRIILPKLETHDKWRSLAAPALIFYIGFLGLRRGLKAVLQREKEEIDHRITRVQ